MSVPRLEALGPFGVSVVGVDLAKVENPEDIRALVDLVAEHGVAVFRGQTLDRAGFDRFGRWWGQPCQFFFTPDMDPEWPDLQRISNSPELDKGRRDGAAFWHTDESFEALPASFTMLYALEAPETGGETLYADMRAAYDALPAETKARIDPLMVRHKLVGGKRREDEAPLGFDVDDPTRDGGVRALKRATEQPLHPLVLTHPLTGRRALYSISGTAFGIEGMDDAAAETLLDELKAHALQPQFRIAAKAGTGDVLIWDDMATLHAATPITYSAEPGRRRTLLRMCVNGLPPVYADRTPAFVVGPDHHSARAAPV